MAEQPEDQIQHDLESKEFQHGIGQGFWTLLDRQGDVLHLNVYARDGVVYLMRLECDSYGQQAIGGKFVDPKTRACVSNAWPRGDGIFGGWVKWDANNLFICWPGDRYGIQHHQEWATQKLWDRPPNPMVVYARFIKELLWYKPWGYAEKAK